MLLALLVLSHMQLAAPGSDAWKERHFPARPNLPACKFASAAKEVKALADLPEQVRRELLQFFKSGGGLADAGGEFNSTDFIDNRKVPHFRFIRAYLTQNVWFIWWEAGGIAHSFNTVALTRQRQQPGSQPVFRLAGGSRFTGNLCAGSRAFLTGARAGSAF